MAFKRQRTNHHINIVQHKWILVIVGIALTLLMVAAQLNSAGSVGSGSIMSRINAVWYDMRFQLLPPQRDALVPIVILDLDEATQQREGRWPWDRSKVAQLVQALQHHGAAIIGFDVVFSEPNPNPARVLLDSKLLPDTAARAIDHIADQFDGDTQFSKVLGENTVLGYFFHADGFSAGELPPPFLEFIDEADAIPGLIRMPDYTGNLPVLTQNALASGFVVAVPDTDGIVRRMPLVMRYQNGVYSSLSLEIVRLALGAPWLRLDSVRNNETNVLTGIRVGRNLRVPLDEHGNMLVPYRGGAKSFPTISATSVLRSDATAEELEQLNGAIVLVGTSALGLSDLRTIPLQTGYPGVEVHANVVDTMLQASLLSGSNNRSPFYHSPDWAPGANLSLILVSGVLLSLTLPGLSPFAMLLRSSFWLLLVVSVNMALWYWWHLALPVFIQVFTVLFIGSFNIAAGYLITNRQKRNIQDLFGEYVPVDHVARMVADPQAVSPEGEQRRMSVLFADIRQFTALSEALSAVELKSVLNRYLSAITEVIFQHNGTIDKYVGDLVMAFWNAPLQDDKHAHNAVAAALAMQVRMEQLRHEFKNEGLPQFHIGIGINTGLMNVGDMGSKYRRAYTVLGDAVNLASRLEGLTSFYGLPILVSDSTQQDANEFIYRKIDTVRVKGRQASLNIYQPLNSSNNQQLISHLNQYEQALAKYREGNLNQAYNMFQTLAAVLPTDPVCTMYISRIKTAQANKTTDPWDPVFNHETK